MTPNTALDFKKVDLFGGAMTVELPATFFDVSDIRQVPDHQEVYLDLNGFTSICIDTMEFVQPSDMPLVALQVHIQDIDENLTWDATRKTTTNVLLPKVTEYSTAVWAQIDTKSGKPSGGANKHANDSKPTNILVLLVRLEKYQTDVLVSVNFKGAGEENDKYYVDAKTYFDKIIETFEIKDYHLFGDRDEH